MQLEEVQQSSANDIRPGVVCKKINIKLLSLNIKIFKLMLWARQISYAMIFIKSDFYSGRNWADLRFFASRTQAKLDF